MNAHTPADVVDAYTGLVTGLVEVPVPREEPDVFVVGAQVADPRVYGLDGDPALRGSGAGVTASDAVDAAVGEACERYACACAPPDAVVTGTAAGLRARGGRPVDPRSWALFAPDQYPQLPYEPLDDGTPLAWARGVDLVTGEERLVPAALVWFGPRAVVAPAGTAPVAPGISTGTACGTGFAPAAAGALLELLERDAVMVAWRAQVPSPRVAIAGGSALDRLFRTTFARPHLRYRLFDVSTDTPAAVCFGLLEDLRATPGSLVAAGAAAPHLGDAVRKTLVELVQGHVWAMDAEGRQGRFDPGPGFTGVRSFEHRMRLYSTNDLSRAVEALGGSPAVSTAGDGPGGTVALAELAERTASAGGGVGPVVAVDITPVDLRDCGLSAVRVLVPGLERMEADHRHPFLGGHRWRSARRRLVPDGPPVPSPFPHPYP